MRSAAGILCILVLALVAGYGIGAYGLKAAIALAALGLALTVFFRPELGFWASIASITIGQLIRIQLPGSDNTVIINDVLLPVLILSWLVWVMARRSWKIPASSLYLPMSLWVIVMMLSLFLNRSGYSSTELLSGALYIVRWIEYAMVLFMGFSFVRSRPGAKKYLVALVWTGVITAILGFVQLKLFPDFSFMVPKGWDPHVGRLLSTWFDPNFLGGYLAFLSTLSLAIALGKKPAEAKWWWLAVAVMTAAIVLTFSRSGYIALAAGVGLVTLLRSKAILFLMLMIFAAIILFVPRVQERVIGIRSIDETAQLRLVSWQNALEVIHDHPVTGIGYNLYKYVQVQYNFLNKTSEHSASGSDSSLLTVWVTTGTAGLFIYLWLLGAMLWEAWKTWRDKKLSSEWRMYGLGLMAGFVALILHGQFVNGLLYPHMMQAMWLALAVALVVRQPETT
ncbi:MAG: O-antigen ligase family protein [Candidatus Kerfeldbacteria bacterium]|nr:O-antigen ligase family protein [Candidatus Kerfeldbacteria bacterium]